MAIEPDLNSGPESPIHTDGSVASADRAAIPCPGVTPVSGSLPESDHAPTSGVPTSVETYDTSSEIPAASAITDARACEKWLRSEGFSRRTARAMASAWRPASGLADEDDTDTKSIAQQLHALAEKMRAPM